MSINLINHFQMVEDDGNRQVLHRVRVNEQLHGTGRPQRWLHREEQAVGKYAHKRHRRVMGKREDGRKIIEYTQEYVFTDANTAFLFALHFRGT